MSSTGNSSSPPSGSTVVPVPPPTAAKRKYDQIVSELGPPAERNPKGKRAKRDTMDAKSPLDKLLSMAKFFPRGVDPYLDIGLVMFYGSEARWAVPVSSDPSNTIVTPPKEQAVARAHIDAFEKMVAISPDSIDVLREFYKDDAQWGRLVSKFREASKSARQHDTSGLKGKTKYLPSDPTKAIVPALSDVDSKSDRGVNHPVLRDAIIPWPLRLQIHVKDENGELTEDATAALKALLHGCKTTDGEPALTHKKFPSCFYADGTYDPQNIDNGLFRSQFLLRIARHIWTAPTSAMDGAETLKKVCHARAHGQFFMTGPMLGYTCCQALTMISTSDWTMKDGHYNYQKLFNSVLKLFADANDRWAIETLDWFTQGVFGGVDTSKFNNEDSDDDDSDSEAATILARRAERSSATPSDS